MPTKRIVPLRDQNEGVIEFDDGPRTVPEDYRRFLEPRQTRVNMTYQEWLAKVVDAHIEQQLFDRAIDALVSAHVRR